MKLAGVLDQFTGFLCSAIGAEKRVEKKISDLESKLEAEEIDWNDPRILLPIDTLRSQLDKEAKRRSGVEDKAKKNLTALAVAASVTTASIALMTSTEGSKLFRNPVGFVAAFALVVGTMFLIAAVLGALKALKISRIYDLTLADEARRDGARAAILLLCLELNQLRTTIRSNWVYASDSCIRNALLALGLFGLLAISSAVSFASKHDPPADCQFSSTTPTASASPETKGTGQQLPTNTSRLYEPATPSPTPVQLAPTVLVPPPDTSPATPRAGAAPPELFPSPP